MSLTSDAIERARARHGEAISKRIEEHRPLLDRMAREGDCLLCSLCRAQGREGCPDHIEVEA